MTPVVVIIVIKWYNKEIIIDNNLGRNVLSPTKELKRIALVGATGTDQFRIKFITNSDYLMYVLVRQHIS